MHRDDRLIGGKPGGGSSSTASQRRGVHGVMVWLDIDQQRCRAGHFDRRDGGDSGMRDSNDRAARADAEPTQRQRDRIRAVAAADHGASAQPGGEFSFERFPSAPRIYQPDASTRATAASISGLQRAIAGAGIGLRDHK